MSAKLYREIIIFLKNQREVLKSFENENLMSNDLKKLFESLRHNLDLLEENTNSYLDKGE